MRVIVSAGGRFHAVDLAAQLQRLGVLHRFITSWFHVRPAHDRIDREHVVALAVPELIGQALKRLPRLRETLPWNYVKDALFDRLACRALDACDIFAGFASFSLQSLPIAKAAGAVTVLERGSAHIEAQRALLQDEYHRHGVKAVPVHQRLVDRQVEEYGRADYICVPSTFARQSFLDRGVKAQRLLVVPYGVDLQVFREPARRETTFRVLFVGELSLQKGVHDLLEAVTRLKVHDLELVLIGTVTPEMTPFLRRHAGRFIHRGTVPRAAMPAEYAQASVLVLPSIHDGFGMVILEAMACGLPVIVSEHTAARDVVRDGLDGFVVPIRDPDAIAARLLTLYEQKSRRLEMGAAARQHAQTFSWDRYGDEMVGAYRRFCGVPGSVAVLP